MPFKILNSTMRGFKYFIFDPSPAARSPAGRREMLHMHVTDPSPGGSRFPGGFQNQINDKQGVGPITIRSEPAFQTFESRHRRPLPDFSRGPVDRENAELNSSQ